MNEKKSFMDTTDFQVEDSFVEDGLLNVLVSRKVLPDEKPDDPEPRWTLLADPKTRELKRIDYHLWEVRIVDAEELERYMRKKGDL